MIGVLGINHNTAALDVRERFSISKDDISELGDLILRNTEISETVILSTCNRTEIYYYHAKSCIKKTDKLLKDILHDYCNIEEDCSYHFYSHSNNDAVNNLFSVTSGIDSMVFGEDQIVRQVKEAYLYCTNLALTDAILMRLFQKSFETAKKVRTETDIQKGATSVSYVAVDKCASIMKSLKNKKVLMIGTGETGRLVVQKLKKYGVSDFTFTNRTFESAKNLAEKNKGEIIEFYDFKNHLHQFDIIITATSAGKIIVSSENIAQTIKERKGERQVFIDLSVPRNIDPTVTNFNEVELFTIDNLNEQLESTAAQRKASKSDAEDIIDKMVNEYFLWLENRSLRPVIKSITDNMQMVHKSEIENYKSCYSDDTYKAVDEYAGRLTQKYIRILIRKLKEMNENGNAAHALKSINELFEFENDNDDISKN